METEEEKKERELREPKSVDELKAIARDQDKNGLERYEWDIPKQEEAEPTPKIKLSTEHPWDEYDDRDWADELERRKIDLIRDNGKAFHDLANEKKEYAFKYGDAIANHAFDRKERVLREKFSQDLLNVENNFWNDFGDYHSDYKKRVESELKKIQTEKSSNANIEKKHINEDKNEQDWRSLQDKHQTERNERMYDDFKEQADLIRALDGKSTREIMDKVGDILQSNRNSFQLMAIRHYMELYDSEKNPIFEKVIKEERSYYMSDEYKEQKEAERKIKEQNEAEQKRLKKQEEERQQIAQEPLNQSDDIFEQLKKKYNQKEQKHGQWLSNRQDMTM